MPQAIPVVAGFLATVGTAVSFGLAGTGLAATLLGGAVIGAAIGGIVSAVSGGDIMKGMLYGAIGGMAIGGAAFGLTSMGVGLTPELAALNVGTGEVLGIAGYSTDVWAGTALAAGAPAATPGSTTVAGGMWEGAGTALVSGAGQMLGAFTEPDIEDHSLAQIASDEKINAANIEAQKEIAKIQAGARGGSSGGGSGDQLAVAQLQADAQARENAADRVLAREQLAGDLSSAESDRETAINKSAQEIKGQQDLRQMDTDEMAENRRLAIAGARSGKVQGRVHSSRSTETLTDVRNKKTDPDIYADPATIVPVEYTDEQPVMGA